MAALKVCVQAGKDALAFLSALSVIALIVLTASGLAGYRMLVVRSGSMAPVLDVGDIVVVKTVDPDAVTPGQVVTFTDPSREDRMVTHRVVSAETLGDRRSFVTRGDANTSSEQWSVAADGRVGKALGRLPRVGFALSGLALPGMRAGILSIAAMAAGMLGLRRIWAV